MLVTPRRRGAEASGQDMTDDQREKLLAEAGASEEEEHTRSARWLVWTVLVVWVLLLGAMYMVFLSDTPLPHT